jgi:hypothetical protein
MHGTLRKGISSGCIEDERPRRLTVRAQPVFWREAVSKSAIN